MRRISIIIAAIIAVLVSARAADPTETSFSPSQCRGSQSLYPADREVLSYPDSLTPVFVNYVGRHGSRFPASSKGIARLTEALQAAAEQGTITATGRKLMELATRVTAATGGQWGALDSIGVAEMRGIATRMAKSYPKLFDGGQVEAVSSYSPRCIMSMYSFAYQLSRLNNKVEITTSSGRRYSLLLRPFDTDAEYTEYREADGWHTVLDAFRTREVTLDPLARALGDVSGYSAEDARELALDEYQLVAGAAAAGVACDSEQFFTLAEYNKLWATANLRQYLLYASNTVSTIPADMASPLLRNLISSTDSVVAGAYGMPSVMLRFGHAETLMPLLSLLRLKGCYYMTNYFDTVALHWRDFDIVPMAANLQLVLFKTKKGRYYVRVELNEQPVPLMPGSDDIYVPWDTARAYMERCIPIFYQP